MFSFLCYLKFVKLFKSNGSVMRGKQKFCGGKFGSPKIENKQGTLKRAAKEQSRKGPINTAEDEDGGEDEN